MKRHIKNMQKRKNPFLRIVIMVLTGAALCSCAPADGKETKESRSEEVTAELQTDNSEPDNSSEEYEFSAFTTEYVETVVETYSCDVEVRSFTFYVNLDEVNYIPYARVTGMEDEVLQWKINHTLFDHACWVFDCSEPGENYGVYNLFNGRNNMQITGIYQYKHYLSVLYENEFSSRIPGKIVYAIVVDMETGDRVLLGDTIVDEEGFKDVLLHYFDDAPVERSPPIFEDDAELILYHSHMTENEIVIDNITFSGEYPERNNGKVDSISWLFDAASFYMTEEGFIVLPGAYQYKPLLFEWEEVSGVVMDELLE